jgi:hypothetical protein
MVSDARNVVSWTAPLLLIAHGAALSSEPVRAVLFCQPMTKSKCASSAGPPARRLLRHPATHMRMDEAPPPDTEPRNPITRALLSNLPILPSGSGVRLGYGMACVAAGLTGAPLLGLVGGSFFTLSSLTGAPPTLTAVAALFVTSIFDFGGGHFDDAFGFCIFLVAMAGMAFIDDDIDLGVGIDNGLEKSARRVNYLKHVESIRAQKAMRQELGIIDTLPDLLEGDSTDDWDKRLSEKADE